MLPPLNFRRTQINEINSCHSLGAPIRSCVHLTVQTRNIQDARESSYANRFNQRTMQENK